LELTELFRLLVVDAHARPFHEYGPRLAKAAPR